MFCNDWQLIIWEYVRAGQYHDESWSASFTGGHDGNGCGFDISRYSDAKIAQDFPGKVLFCTAITIFKITHSNFISQDLKYSCIHINFLLGLRYTLVRERQNLDFVYIELNWPGLFGRCFALINGAGGLCGRILTEVVSTLNRDQDSPMQTDLHVAWVRRCLL